MKYLQTMTKNELVDELAQAFQLAAVNPAKDTIVSAVEKFRALDLRHLVVYVENGGFLCLCADPEMSRRMKDAIHRIDEDMMAEFENANGERI